VSSVISETQEKHLKTWCIGLWGLGQSAQELASAVLLLPPSRYVLREDGLPGSGPAPESELASPIVYVQVQRLGEREDIERGGSQSSRGGARATGPFRGTHGSPPEWQLLRGFPPCRLRDPYRCAFHRPRQLLRRRLQLE
jgi:hypothetical protein